jgi:hypothetical protein
MINRLPYNRVLHLGEVKDKLDTGRKCFHTHSQLTTQSQNKELYQKRHLSEKPSFETIHQYSLMMGA